MASQILLLSSPFLILSLLAHASFLSSFAYSASTGRKEAEALLEWKVSLDSKSQSLLSSWAGDSPCNWFGISCDRSGSVINISLPGSSLRGTLNSLIFSSFPSLIGLNLFNNSLYGSIPSHIGILSNLTILDLSFNDISGTIPASLENLRNLSELYLFDNSLVGPITSIGNLTASLTILDLSSNKLTGTIPASFANLQSLSELDLSDNSLVGPIIAIGNLTASLTILDFVEFQKISKNTNTHCSDQNLEMVKFPEFDGKN